MLYSGTRSQACTLRHCPIISPVVQASAFVTDLYMGTSNQKRLIWYGPVWSSGYSQPEWGHPVQPVIAGLRLHGPERRWGEY